MGNTKRIIKIKQRVSQLMQQSGFSEYKDHRLVDKMTDRERELFVVVRSIGNKQITFLLDAISKLLKKEDGKKE